MSERKKVPETLVCPVGLPLIWSRNAIDEMEFQKVFRKISEYSWNFLMFEVIIISMTLQILFSLSTSELFRTQSNSPTLLNLQRTAQVLNLHVGEMFKLEFLKFMYFCCSLRYINTVALPYLISSRPRERAQASGTFFRSLNSQY